jgi:SAM-dependent methyltransferase
MTPEAPREVTYTFRAVEACAMCGAPQEAFRFLGRRLNGSQGLRPRKRVGVTTTIVRCHDCGLIFSNPQPIPARFEDHYDAPPDSYWGEGYFVVSADYLESEIRTARTLLGTQRDARIRALDIGAGIGKGMRALAAAGMDVWGIEPSPSFRRMALEGMGIDPRRIVEGPMESAKFEGESFDFVTFGAVLEHLYEPAHAIARALGWLRPGGILHAEVPSSDWLMARLANAYFRLAGTDFVTHTSPMHPPYHLFEFTPEAFRRNAQRLGYRLERVERYVGDTYAPRLLAPILRTVMRVTNTGMQLGIWIRKDGARS